MRAALIPVVILLLASGCTQEVGRSPDGHADKPQCPLVAEPQEGVVNTEIGEYNMSLAGSGASYSYDDFSWDWSSGSLISMNVSAVWDAGTTGEKTMQMRVFDRHNTLHPYALVHGESPIVVNFTMRVPDDTDLAVGMEPVADTAGMPVGVAVSKASVNTQVTMVQTLLCDPA